MKVNTRMIQEMNRLYDKGKTVRQLAIKFNLSPSTITTYTWRPRNRGGQGIQSRVSEEEIREMNKLYQKGARVFELATMFCVSRPTISKYIKNPRVQHGGVANKVVVTDELIEQINTLYNQPLTMQGVSKILKIRLNTVCQYVECARKQGVKLNHIKEVKQ